MKHFILLLFLFSMYQLVFALPDSTLFKNAFEQEVFEEVIKDSNTGSFPILGAITMERSEIDKTRNQLKQFVNELKATNIQQKSLKKQVMTIYKSVHSHFLRKYVEESYFGDIFRDGSYNCVSASALYALILEEFGISYAIKETSVHVYLIADPKHQKILIETTMPSKGIRALDDRYKKNFVEYLRDTKLISESEFNSKSTEELFESHYTTDESIHLNKLAALQYYNQGIFYSTEEKYREAANSFEKASLVYPSTSILYMLNLARINVMSEQVKSRKYDGKLLAKYISQNPESSETEQMGKEYFNEVSNEWVINHPSPEKYNNFYIDFIEWVSDSIDIGEYTEEYYRLMGYQEYVKMNYPKSLQYLDETYELNPENIRTRDLIKSAASSHLFKDYGFEALIDSFEVYFNKFPFLSEIDAFLTQYGYDYLRVIANAYVQSDEAKGELYLQKLDEARIKYPKMILPPDIITYAFQAVSRHYVQEVQYDKAVIYLKMGLDFSPQAAALQNSLDLLLEQKSSLEKYMKSDMIAVDPINSGYRTNNFSADFDRYFTGCWISKSMFEEGEEIKIPADEALEFEAKSNKDLQFSSGPDSERGNWSVRKNYKLVYFTNVSGTDDYLVFKVIDISENTLVLMPYEDGKTPSGVTVKFVRCS